MIDFHTYSQIKDLYDNKHFSFEKIGNILSIDPRTVAAWAKKDRYGRFKRKRKPSRLDHYKSAIYREFELTQCTAACIFRSLTTLGYEGGYTVVRDFVADLRIDSGDGKAILPTMWMLMLLQGKITAVNLVNEYALDISITDAERFVSHICNGKLRERNRAIIILASLNNIPVSSLTKFLMIDERTVYNAIHNYNDNGVSAITSSREVTVRKHDKTEYKDALFSLLHSPPSEYDINRTSWTMKDLHRIMKEKGMKINKDSIRRIINDAGYKFRKAKKVLTSTDPDYREKLKAITEILSKLGEDECFFSIDEYGPFSVKMKGGLALSGPREPRIVPQWQKSKGSLILTGALELSSNQITHFYSEKKNTDEMIKLLHLLLVKYNFKRKIYFSWDAASWHASKALDKEVSRINNECYRNENNTPLVILAPLPKCAQFLNVIESVFSGMARAIIHNSNYQSVDDCKSAIDRYYSERNEYFMENPKRAGNKIWGKELVIAEFVESNNCKDPTYR